MDGAQGGVSIVHAIGTDAPGIGWTSYYLDKANPGGGAETQCTGDASAYGSSGPWINQGIPNTDPRSAPFNTFTATRTLFFELPGKADGPKRAQQVATPMQISVAPVRLRTPLQLGPLVIPEANAACAWPQASDRVGANGSISPHERDCGVFRYQIATDSGRLGCGPGW